jgi:hypothetical protein
VSDLDERHEVHVVVALEDEDALAGVTVVVRVLEDVEQVAMFDVEDDLVKPEPRSALSLAFFASSQAKYFAPINAVMPGPRAMSGHQRTGRDIPSFISGNRRSSSAPFAVTMAWACSRVPPGASTLSVGLPRSFKVGSVIALTGTYALGAMKPVTDR